MDTAPIDALLAECQYRPENLIELLQDIQGLYNFLPEEALWKVSESCQIPVIEVFRVANFYKTFTLKPRGRHLITICTGTACHVRGAPKFVDEVCNLLKIGPGETTEDNTFTLETVNCVGACALGPVLIMDGTYHGHMTSSKLRNLIQTTLDEDMKDSSYEKDEAT